MFLGRAAIVPLLAFIGTALVHGAELPPDPALQSQLQAALHDAGLQPALRDGRMSVALVDVSDPAHPRYAGLNDRHMMYAASLPKIAILLAGFEKISQGMMIYNPAVREMFVRLTRFSSNTDASRAIQSIGFDFIARVLQSDKYRLYDPAANGGLWIGKAYGGPNDYWKRDPLHNLSHGATAFQVARFFTLLAQGKLVSPEFSEEMKRILGDPGIEHKFVKGLAGLPRQIYRKSGTWGEWHSDAALVEAGDRRYVAVALMKDPKGGEALSGLIRKLDRVICGNAELNLAGRPEPSPSGLN
ncbi:MAG: serine hydrolase [Bryobacteraceae bacterium]|nr:serine hydrolase [Bryobacteraceae bacterium]